MKAADKGASMQVVVEMTGERTQYKYVHSVFAGALRDQIAPPP